MTALVGCSEKSWYLASFSAVIVERLGILASSRATDFLRISEIQ